MKPTSRIDDQGRLLVRSGDGVEHLVNTEAKEPVSLRPIADSGIYEVFWLGGSAKLHVRGTVITGFP